MALIIFEDLPSKNTPINSDNLNNNFNEVFNLVYPVGRGFIDFTNTDYSNYLGFTWERTLVGLTPIGLDTKDSDFNTIGKKGGEKKHTLTIDEMPNHSHDIVYKGNGKNLNLNSGSGDQYTLEFGVNGNQMAECEAKAIGGGQAHNILQPYEVVAYWKRIA